MDFGTLADHWGTPLYVLDQDRLRANLTRLADALSPDRPLYSLKTNYLPSVTETVLACGFGVDVVSGYELRAALRAGFTGDRIVFNGPVKTADELRAAVLAGVFVNIDGEQEIDVLAGLAPQAGLPVGLRVTSPLDVYADVRPLPRRATPSKFGWSVANGDADRLAALIGDRRELRLTGVHCHLGSQITSVAALVAALAPVLEWTAKLADRAGIEVLNLGGGFGVPGIRRVKGAVAGLSEVRAATTDPGEQELFDPAALAVTVRSLLREHGLADVTVCWEPGRAVVSDAMSLVTTVASVKRTGDGTWVLLDGGLSLLPTAGVAERHEYQALRTGAPNESFLLGGPLCYEGDVFSLAARLPGDIRAGDRVVIGDAGAYGVTRATSFNRPRAAVVSVSGDVAELCWRQENDEDIFRFQVTKPGGS